MPFVYGGVIASGSETQDFGIGMIEKGVDNKLWFVGEGRLGTLNDYNNPQSVFTPSAFGINNSLSMASVYQDSTPNSSSTTLDVLNRQLYLLMDQIDGEGYELWSVPPNFYPSYIEHCGYPYTFPYNIPQGAIVTYTGQMSSNCDLLSDGTMTIYYVSGECEYSETIHIYERNELWCEAVFTRQITELVEPDVIVTASCDIYGLTQHSYRLYESNGQGGWLLLDDCYSANCTLTGLYNGQTFRITHKVISTNSVCHLIEVSTQTFTIY